MFKSKKVIGFVIALTAAGVAVIVGDPQSAFAGGSWY